MKTQRIQILNKEIEWKKNDILKDGFAYSAQVEGKKCTITVNADFPMESLYTLFVDGKEEIHFNDWPKSWVTDD